MSGSDDESPTTGEIDGKQGPTPDSLIPKRVIEAADQTTDEAVLKKLWEVTKFRLDEEKHRQDSANDRAGKCVTYSLSILAAIGIAGAFLKDLIHDAAAHPSWVNYVLFPLLAISLLGVLIHSFKAWKSATTVLEVKNYNTWNEVDLSLVHLGDGEKGYVRHLIKSAWAFLPGNEATTSEKFECLMDSIGSLRDALICLCALIVTTLITAAAVGTNMVEVPKASNLEVTCVTNTNGNQGGSQSKPVPPQPTPQPTTGQPIRKSEDIPSRPLQPQPPKK